MLKAIIDKLEDVEEALRGFYVQKGDKWELQVDGMKSPGDVQRVQAALDKEKKDHKTAKDELAQAKAKLTAFGDVDPDALAEQQQELETLRAAAAGNVDQQKIAQQITDGVASKMKGIEAKHKRELEARDATIATLTGERDGIQTRFNTKVIEDGLRAEAIKLGVVPAMVDDFVRLGASAFKLEDDKPTTEDAMDIASWIGEQKKSRPYFWPAAQGANGRGGDGKGGTGKNPFSNEHWNLTEQGQIVRENAAEANRLAEAAGTKVGGGRPKPKAA